MEIREAQHTDETALTRLTETCFPAADPDREALLPGQVAEGIRHGRFLVAVDNERLVGFAEHFDTSTEGEAYLEGVGVAPDARGKGLARVLVQAVLDHYGSTSQTGPVLAMTVSPSNVPMVRTCVGLGFVADHFLRDYFGPGADRLFFRSRFSCHVRLRESIYLPVTAHGELASLLDDDWILDGCETLPQGLAYRLRGRVFDDQAGLDANEVSVSLTVAAALVASFSFLVGIALTEQRFPGDLLGLTGFGLVCSTFAMMIYGKGSGTLARIGDLAAHRGIIAGNLLSEFGGYFTLLAVVPVAIVRLLPAQHAIGMALCVFASLGLLAYQFGGMAMIDRYELPTWQVMPLKLTLSLVPAVGGLVALAWSNTTVWSAATLILLGVAMTLCWLKQAERMAFRRS